MKKQSTPLRKAPLQMSKEEALEAFAAAAGQSPEKVRQKYPWEAPGVREDVMKSFPLRMTEPVYLKLKFIAENSQYSMNSFVLEKISAAIEEEIAKVSGR